MTMYYNYELRNHAFGFKLAYIIVGHSEARQDLVRVLAQRGRRAADPWFCVGEFDWSVDQLYWPARWVFDLNHHVSGLDCWGSVCGRVSGGYSPCGWFNVVWMSLMAAYGMPLPSKISSHSCVVLVCVTCSITVSSSALFLTRSLFVKNFGSVAHSGLPIRSHRMRKSLSFPPPSKISPSPVLKPL